MEKTAVAPPSLKSKADDNAEWIKRIHTREEKINEFQNDACKTVAKIGKICIDTVQKEFFSVQTSWEWTPIEIWSHLRNGYTLQNWTSKWNILEKLHEIQDGNCKDIQEFKTKISDMKFEIEELEITMDEVITI